MYLLKSMRREIIRQLRGVRRKKKTKKQDGAICYSAAGFLADVLEYNGFVINELKRSYRGGVEGFNVTVGIVDIEPFRARIRKSLDRLNLLDIKP
jgi:hypothetical protein